MHVLNFNITLIMKFNLENQIFYGMRKPEFVWRLGD